MGGTTTKTSAYVGPITYPAPSATTIPQVTVTKHVLSVTDGVWTKATSDSKLNYDYQWYYAASSSTDKDSATIISSATSATFTINSSTYIDKYLCCRVTATDSISTLSTSIYSAYTARITNAVPTLDSTVANNAVTLSAGHIVDDSLTCNKGTWTDTNEDTIAYAYAWYRATDTTENTDSTSAIGTNATYTITSADVGKYLRCKVTASDGLDGSTSAYSAYTSLVTAANPPTFTKGGNLTVSASNTGLRGKPAWATDINDGTSSGATVTFICGSSNSSFFRIAPRINSTGDLFFAVRSDATGTVTVTVTPKANNVSGASQTFTVTAGTEPTTPPTASSHTVKSVIVKGTISGGSNLGVTVNGATVTVASGAWTSSAVNLSSTGTVLDVDAVGTASDANAATKSFTVETTATVTTSSN